MGATSIGWTDFTFNPWFGCTKVSPGCTNCYASAFAKRIGHGARLPNIWGPKAPRRFFGDKHWAEPLRWNDAAARAGVRARVFCASMADVFEVVRHDVAVAGEMIAARERLWKLIDATPNLDWLLLTKRPENIAKIAPWRARVDENVRPPWPRNVWIGTTCEDQRRADERLPHLLQLPAAVRFVSAEPLLGPVDFGLGGVAPKSWGHGYTPVFELLNWIIVGGESGGGARPFELAWARAIVREGRKWEIPVFVKQLGARASDPENGIAGAHLKVPSDAAALISLRLKHPKGEDIAEWPNDLRVREWPRVA